MASRLFRTDSQFYIYENVVLAAAASWLLAAPGFKFSAFFGSMFMLAFGPMTEHLFWQTTTSRWIVDVAFCLVLLSMILIRYRWKSRYLIAISHVGVILWYASA